MQNAVRTMYTYIIHDTEALQPKVNRNSKSSQKVHFSKAMFLCLSAFEQAQEMGSNDVVTFACVTDRVKIENNIAIYMVFLVHICF